MEYARIIFELEMKFGLGMVEFDEDFERRYLEGEQKLPFFDAIQKILHENADGCRFCDPYDDCNEKWTEADVKKICFSCRRRLSGLSAYFGEEDDETG